MLVVPIYPAPRGLRLVVGLRFFNHAIGWRMWRRPRGPKSDRSLIARRLRVKALTHALLIGVCPNFGPSPPGEAAPFILGCKHS